MSVTGTRRSSLSGAGSSITWRGWQDELVDGLPDDEPLSQEAGGFEIGYRCSCHGGYAVELCAYEQYVSVLIAHDNGFGYEKLPPQ